MEAPNGKKHTLMLDDRQRLILSGAEDVSGFNEECVTVKTTAGVLTIKGSGLHIDSLNLETGDVTLNGAVSSLQYSGGGGSRSRLSRLFRQEGAWS